MRCHSRLWIIAELRKKFALRLARARSNVEGRLTV